MFYFKKTTNNQWRWAFISSNGQQSASTEKFPTRSNAKRAAKKFLIAAMKSQSMEYDADSFVMKEWEDRPGTKKKKYFTKKQIKNFERIGKQYPTFKFSEREVTGPTR